MGDLYLRDTAKTIRSWSEHDVAMKPDLAFDVIQTVVGRMEEAADHIETLEARIRELDENLLDPEMPSQQMRLHMGEMTAQELRTARAAIAWANSTARAALEESE